MMQRAFFTAAIFSALPAVLALPRTIKRDECTDTKTVRKPWSMLTDDEKSAYLDAELCLMEAPAQLDIDGAVTRWDDLQHNHIVQTQVVHDVGQFLPWHRYYVTVHAELLRDECGYNGSIPYWDETADSELSDLTTAAVFQADAFGGDGDGDDDDDCITTGPFVNTTLHLKRLGNDPEDYCISRSINLSQLQQAGQTYLDDCMAIDNYTSAWECWHSSPHNAGHGGTGGVMVDVVLSPGDPMFYLHHTWLDAQWWKWQSADLDNRLTDMGGRNVPRESYIEQGNLPEPTAEWTDYFGDGGGNTTTLNHVLYASEIRPNVTVGDVMDVGGSTICSAYVYSDE